MKPWFQLLKCSWLLICIRSFCSIVWSAPSTFACIVAHTSSSILMMPGGFWERTQNESEIHSYCKMHSYFSNSFGCILLGSLIIVLNYYYFIFHFFLVKSFILALVDCYCLYPSYSFIYSLYWFLYLFFHSILKCFIFWPVKHFDLYFKYESWDKNKIFCSSSISSNSTHLCSSSSIV